MKQFGLTVTTLTNLESIKGLEHAVDNRFRRLVNQARAEWDRKIREKDPSDASVSVNIAPVPATPARPGVRGSDFVKSSRKTGRPANISLPGFAHGS